ncbi:MAG: response regulator [Desulfobacteraceae bacterium]|nr:response regulator [Desulfobacteraceae bacterium]
MGTILVVDDEQGIRTMLQGLIQRENHEVLLAGDGYTALELLKTTAMDVVLTDLLLPGMTGIELLKIIRREFPGIQVIMITGMPTIESATEGLRLGAFDYMSKPVSGEVVLKTIRNAILVKRLNDEKERLKEENHRYRERLEYLAEERIRSLKDKVVIVQKDVTEKKRLQAEALQISHLASLGELAAGIAHEINNPVNGIISYAEILKDECEDQGRDDEIACRIIKEGERIATIVSNLLYFARDVEEEYAPVHLGTILEATLSLIGKQISKDGITLERRLRKGLADIRAKSREIQQVFLNIISNARYALNQKFPGMHPDKLLEITATTVEVSGVPHVRTMFYDNGTGIPDAIIHKINTPFFSTKPPGQGTGLGLSISHGIVTSHGGKLTFQSREKEFTRVIVDLPAATNPESGRGE